RGAAAAGRRNGGRARICPARRVGAGGPARKRGGAGPAGRGAAPGTAPGGGAGLLTESPWTEMARRDRAVLAAALGRWGEAKDLAAADPGRPSEAVRLARGASPIELVLARAMGAEWLDRYVQEWRNVKLQIDGDDLIAAGVPQGPGVGRGLSEALCRKLDGEISGREPELEVALAAARSEDA